MPVPRVAARDLRVGPGGRAGGTAARGDLLNNDINRPAGRRQAAGQAEQRRGASHRAYECVQQSTI